MNRKIGFNWIAVIAAAFALTTSAFAAQRVTNNENTTNETTYGTASTSRDSNSKKVNINSATKSELESLPGVGPSIADNIIAARPFKSISALKDVNGIGEQRYQEIRPHVTVAKSTAAGAPADNSSARASGSDKPTAKAQSENVIPRRAKADAGGGGAVTTDSVHSGSDKPGAREKEETRANRSVTSARSNSAKVNLNTASKEELEALPAIGPVKAQAIIDNRPYRKTEDIMKIDGIKEGTYEKIRDQITVR